MNLPREKLALLEALAAISLWAVSFVFIKIILREISPVTLIVVRFSVGALVVGAVAWRRGDLRRLQRADLPGLALVGALGIGLQQLLQVSGQARAEAGVAAVLASTAPAFTVGLAAAFLRERLRPLQGLGVLLAAGGAVVVATNGQLGMITRGQFGAPGSLLVLVSAGVWALFIILNKRVVHQRPSTAITAGLFLFGALFVLPVFIWQQGWRDLPGLSPLGWLGLLYVALLSTCLAYLINTHALKHLSASRVAMIQNLEPLIAMGAAALLLGEAITAAMLAGGAAILVGVYLAELGGAAQIAESPSR